MRFSKEKGLGGMQLLKDTSTLEIEKAKTDKAIAEAARQVFSEEVLQAVATNRKFTRHLEDQDTAEED